MQTSRQYNSCKNSCKNLQKLNTSSVQKNAHTNTKPYVKKYVGLSAVAATLELKLARNATTYVVFTESLTVAYAIDQNLNVSSATVKVVELFASNDSVRSDITSVKLPIATGLLSGEFNLLCGTIDHAGRYRLQLDFDTDVGSGSTKTAPVEAVWPPLVVSLPPTHVALDSNVRVSVTLTPGRYTSPRCRSLHADPGQFILELVYFGRVETKNGQRVVEPRKVKEHSIFLIVFILV